MRIGFDAKRLFTNFTGLGNYSRFVVDALANFQPENNYYLYTPRIKHHAEINVITTRSNVSVVRPCRLYTFLKASSIWRSWGVTRHASIGSLDVFHGLSQEIPFGLPLRVKKVVTVHDLIYFRYPQFYNPIDVAVYKAKVKFACKIADTIIAISEQTAQDLIEFLKVDAEKIKIVYQGCHPIFKQRRSTVEIESVKRKYFLPEKYILSIGTIEERKNVLIIIKAFELLHESVRIPIVIVGRSTSYALKVKAYIKKRQLENWVQFLHQSSFVDFPAIYQGATVFVYPSLFEGFGIPLIEAIESGIPVITSKGSCFREAAGPDAIYIDSQDENDLASAFMRLISEDQSSRIDKQKKYIQRFSPAVIAKDLMNVYKTI